MILANVKWPKKDQTPQPKPNQDIHPIPDDSDEEPEEKPSLKKYLLSLARDILIAVIVMVIIIGSLWAYTSNWPPMVVIESNSMMHGDDSSIGTIDTGDLVLVKKISSRNDIKTYVQGRKSDYKTYGSYGDVIIFKKNGLDDTPVIHRAVVWIEYNASGSYYKRSSDGNINLEKKGSYDVPDLGYYNVVTFSINDYVPGHKNITIDLTKMLDSFELYKETPHSGFLTKGDNNDIVDQMNLPDSRNRLVKPIKINWIVGKAEGELPWFGLIKLYVSGEINQKEKAAPPTSRNMLILSIALIIIIPIILDLSLSYLSKVWKKRKEMRGKNGLENKSENTHMGSTQIKRPIPPPPSLKTKYEPPIMQGKAGPKAPEKVGPRQEPTSQQKPFTSKEDLFKKIK